MTYAGFLLLFVGLPLLAVAYAVRKSVRPLLMPMAALLVVVYAATSPWDNAAVARGLWGFHPERVWGVYLGRLPLEEYLFFGLQTLLTGLWAGHRLLKLREPAR